MKRRNKILLSTFSILAACAIATPVLTSCAPHKFNAKIIGHRGCPSDKRSFENTNISFEIAGKSNYYYGIECDVYPNTVEGNVQLYVVHDEFPFYDSTKSVTQITSEDAENLSLKPSKGYPKDNPGLFAHNYQEKKYKIPKFSEYLNICKIYEKTAIIELKDTTKWTAQDAGIWTDNAITELSKEIKENVGNNYVLISFDNNLLEHIAQNEDKFHLPKAKMQQLFDPDLVNAKDSNVSRWGSWEYIADQEWNIDIGDIDSPSTTDWGIGITKYMVDTFHAKNLQFNVWTINTLDRAQALDALGVDYITTDYIL